MYGGYRMGVCAHRRRRRQKLLDTTSPRGSLGFNVTSFRAIEAIGLKDHTIGSTR